MPNPCLASSSLKSFSFLGKMELPFSVGQSGDHLVGRHLAPLTVESGEDCDGTVKVRLADMNKRELVVSKRVREAICFVEPALGPSPVINVCFDAAARSKESSGAEQAPHREMLWSNPTPSVLGGTPGVRGRSTRASQLDPRSIPPRRVTAECLRGSTRAADRQAGS